MPETAAGHGVVAGRVETPEGKPMKGAPVSWVSRVGEEPQVLATVATDETGRFVFSNAAQLRRKDAAAQVTVEVPGWGVSFLQVPVEDEALVLTLSPATTLHATFVDPQGQAVPQVPVRTVFLQSERHAWLFLPRTISDRLLRRTDPTGNVTISGLPQGYQVRLAVEDDRFAQLSFEEDIYLGTGPVSETKPIRLLPAGSIQGKVTFGPTGKPAAGIRVGAGAVVGGGSWGEAVTGPDGSYQIKQLRPSVYNVALDLKGELAKSWTARAHERLTVAAGEHLAGKDLTLIPGAIIQGKVTAADNGQPVAGLGLGVYGPAHPRSGAWVGGAESGPDGTYAVRVPGGKQHLYIAMAALPGYVLPEQSGRDLTVQDGETVTVDFKLARRTTARPVQGRVVGPDGKPIADAEIVGAPVGRFGLDPAWMRSDADGRFRLSERFLAEPVALRARHEGMATTSATLVTGGEEVTLRLAKDALVSLSGRVADAEGKPMAGARVRLIQWAYDMGNEAGKATTDEQGRYAFAGLWPDLRYSVGGSADGFGESSTRTVQLGPGQSQTLDLIVLRKADRSVAGRVVDGNGDPVPGAWVLVSGNESVSRRVFADGEGRFRVDGLVDEMLSLYVRLAEELPVHKQVKAGSQDVILVLPGGEQEGARVTREQEQRFERLRGQAAPPLNAVAWVNAEPGLARELRGKVVLIDFWSIGCGPCVASLPGVQAAADQLKARGAVVIGLHDSGATPEKLREFAKEHKLTFPLAIDAPDEQKITFGKTFRTYGVQGIPSVAVIDRNSKVAYLGNFLTEALARVGALLAQ
jgi:protocatechuate 3,4-dioxygenase beta subunit/peroxiredoxin